MSCEVPRDRFLGRVCQSFFPAPLGFENECYRCGHARSCHRVAS